MVTTTIAVFLAAVGAIQTPVTAPMNVSAQTVGDRIDAISAVMKRLQDFSARMANSSGGAKLSTGAQQLIYLSRHWDELGPQLATSFGGRSAPLTGQGNQSDPATDRMTSAQVSDPRHDLKVSRVGGFTQSETSTAWCGSHVVVGFNDSGSFLESFPVPSIGLSFNGWSLSTDGGRTFTDLGFVTPGPQLSNFLGGDPVVVCTDQNTFYQSSIFTGLTTSGVGVQRSTDGGLTWGDPVAAVSKDGFFHFIDKPWLAADPSNPSRLYVTYTDFDFSGSGPCPFFRLGIELVSSSDRGATWSAPTVIDETCFPDFLQGSSVAVDSKGVVHVAWERLPAATVTNEIDSARSTNHGASFSPRTLISIVTPVGSFFGTLQGGFRNNEFPNLAVDPTQSDRLFVTWNDGRNGVIPDFFPFSPPGSYRFGDVFVSRSDDSGRSWTAARKVNTDAGAANHIDHFLPGVAVDSNGSVGICFYDRRRDAQNFLIDRECALSTNGGLTWKNLRVTKTSFAPNIGGDILVNPVYMGDYDGVTADVTGASNGFLSSYGDNLRGNPDVFIAPRFGGNGDTNNDVN